ncbi:hypothetical protein BDV25DRAFT_128516 [Aspergillus avenaceus]|uniref:Uncharacterized protein n=1 Tax=Aspergillus avenaceus TaxID=36643 RepID=A0A5N6TZP6_ASPAV|nr:hypothetical protein BDV25DRAFT_128516 [Aspergillus avenaceus]
MANTTQSPSGVLLVGSIPLSSAEEVFTITSSELPNRLQSIPDGETGSRDNYIRWQDMCFPKETLKPHLGGIDLPPGYPGTFTLADVNPTHYDTVALESYKTFAKLRNEGIIPPGIRFQVSLPPPLNTIQGHVKQEFQAQIEPLYEQRMLEAVATIIDGIPAEDLALQWDLCFEITALEHQRGRLPDPFFKPHFSPVTEGILQRMQRLLAAVPGKIPLGLHLCYGDYQHRHFVEPTDLSLLVDLANQIATVSPRPLSWIHMPVPKSRHDRAYFDPLRHLDIGDTVHLYLGLVHPNDEEGTRRRISTAQSVVQRFGVATECGMGRTPRAELDSILAISRNVTTGGV